MQNLTNFSTRYRVGVLLFDEFSNLCLANTIEPLRAVNRILGQEIYDWQFLSMDGAALRSSSGLPVQPDAALRDHEGGDMLVLMPSYGYKNLVTPDLCKTLRARCALYAHILALDMGAWLVAAAGLPATQLTVHWDAFDELAEQFPQINVTPERYVIDGKWISSGGAMTTLELMLEWITRRHGAKLAIEVASLFMHGERDPHLDPHQRTPRDRLVYAATAKMRRALEEPLQIPQLAKSLGTTQRKLETQFQAVLGATPHQIYTSMRMHEARRLVATTQLSISEIAGRCGYLDPTALTRRFRQEFGQSPQELRRQLP
ncbi:MAG: helix-turn-helix domain-containing protein [Paracoccaceae bacterium]|jgi:transcriptional regulator GlxA family with amidase domain